MEIRQFIKAPIAKPFLTYKLERGRFPSGPLYAPPPPITSQYFPPPPVKTPFLQISAKYWKKNKILSISQKLYGLDVVGLKWKEHKKKQPCFVSFSRFDSGNVNINKGWGYGSGYSEAVTPVVNKAVLFHGVRLFRSNGGRYQVKCTIKDKNVTGSYTSEQDSDHVQGYDVMLPNPIPLLPNEEITIIATITGPNSYWGTRGKSSVTIDDIVVTFKDARSGL